jgi:hypothetical protein
MKTLEFKTISPFFELCRDGKKPFDIRLQDTHDPRFRALSQVRLVYPLRNWAVKFTNPETNESFTRELFGWDYLYDHDKIPIQPNWIIMYLGKVVPEGSAH